MSTLRPAVLASALGCALGLSSGCIEIPEFDPISEPNNLGSELDDTGGNCSPGTFECVCRPDSSCNAGLECVEGLCQGPGTGDGDGDPTGDGDGEPTGDGDGEPTGDGDGEPTGDGDGDPEPICIDDGDCPYAHACDGGGQCVFVANYAFVTSQAVPPDFGGIEGADEICQNSANAAGLDGTFIALLTDSGTPDPASRLAGFSGWVRTDLRNFANDPYDMVWSAQIYYPLTLDEFGQEIGAVPVYTGGIEGGNHCSDWSFLSAAESAGVGYSGDGGWEWIDWSFLTCSEALAHLYCFQTDNEWSDTPPLPPVYRRAFVSQTLVYGYEGAGVMNQACYDEAVAAGLVGMDEEVFLAWVATDGTTPADMFDVSGPPWVRIDDVTLAEVDANNDGTPDITDPSSYLAPLNLQTNGSRVSGWVWTGTTGPVVPGDPSTTCTGWTDVNGTGNVGYASHVDEQFGLGVLDCYLQAPVYCFEQ